MKNILLTGLLSLLLLYGAGRASASPDFSCLDVLDVPVQECQALVALYNATDGSGWTNSTNWLTGTGVDSWYGVTVAEGHVTRLELPANHLLGSIPPEIGDLTSLQSLYLCANWLTGAIPSTISNLSSLVELDLGGNMLTGSIPSTLGHLSNLMVLNLSFNQLTGSIPSALGDLSSLTSLNLSANQLSGTIPIKLGQLTNLQHFSLAANQLSGSLPPVLGSLSNLTYLNVFENLLSGSLPAELGNLSELTFLNLSENLFSGSIPVELGNLTALTSLYLSDNQLSGSIPLAFGSLVHLNDLWLQSNQLNGSIPEQLGNLIQLKTLWLNDNLLSGNIPETLLNLTSLYDAGLYDGADGLDLDYNLLALPTGYPDLVEPLQEFLAQKDPDWHLRQGFSIQLSLPGGEFTSLDGRVHVDVPNGALEGKTIFTFHPQPAPSQPAERLIYANNSFLLSAVTTLGVPVIFFDSPLTVTISYAPFDHTGFPETSLALYYWSGVTYGWLDATLCCPGGEYDRDLRSDTLTFPLWHLSEFALFGSNLHVFLPLVRQ